MTDVLEERRSHTQIRTHTHPCMMSEQQTTQVNEGVGLSDAPGCGVLTSSASLAALVACPMFRLTTTFSERAQLRVRFTTGKVIRRVLG